MQSSSTAIEQLVHYCNQQPNAVLAFFYFDFNDTKKVSFDALIRSLVTQLFSKCETIPAALLELHEHNKKNSQSVDTDSLVEVFRELLRDCQNVYIVLDALDESPECEEVLRFIENMQDWNLSQVHLLITSRQWTIIEESFGSMVPDRICLQDSQSNKDILIYIEQKLANDKVITKWPSEIRQNVREKLVAESQGMLVVHSSILS